MIFYCLSDNCSCETALERTRGCADLKGTAKGHQSRASMWGPNFFSAMQGLQTPRVTRNCIKHAAASSSPVDGLRSVHVPRSMNEACSSVEGRRSRIFPDPVQSFSLSNPRYRAGDIEPLPGLAAGEIRIRIEGASRLQHMLLPTSVFTCHEAADPER